MHQVYKDEHQITSTGHDNPLIVTNTPQTTAFVPVVSVSRPTVMHIKAPANNGTRKLKENRCYLPIVSPVYDMITI